MRTFPRVAWVLPVIAWGLVAGPQWAGAEPFTDGFQYERAGDYPRARQAYESACRAANAPAEACYHLGLVYEQLGDSAAAVAAYRSALKAEPDSPFAVRFRTNLGWALIDSGRVADGIAELQRVVEEIPDADWAVANVAHALFDNAQDYNRAEVWYQRLADDFAVPAEQKERVARWLREAKQRATIVKIGTGYEIHRGEIVAGTYQGVNYGPIDDPRSIELMTINGVRKRIPTDEIRFFDTEPKYKGMGITLRGSIAKRERRRFDIIFAPENMREGHTASSAGRYAVAQVQYTMALLKNPDSTVARMALAQTLYQRKAYKEAAREFEATLDVDSRNAKARRYLISVYANYLQDMPKALHHALAYLSLPDADEREQIQDAAVRIVRRVIAANRGKPERVWAREAGLSFENATHRFVLGQAYMQEQEYGPALRHLGAAVQMAGPGRQAEAFAALKRGVDNLATVNPNSPDVAYYRAYIAFATGHLNEAATALDAGTADPRTQTLRALVHAYRGADAEARLALNTVDRAALPPHTQGLYDIVEAVLTVADDYDADLAARREDGFQYARVGAVNGLGVYSETNTGDLMPIICVAKERGHGTVEVNGNPQFDFFSVLSFKEAFDWMGNEVDVTFPREWDTTITFGGLSLYLGKGGDSAGCAIALALRSAVLQEPALQDAAVTGAIRLDGRVEPVGAISEKVVGAVEHHIRTIVLPAANVADLGNPDGDACSSVKFVTVSAVDQAVYHVFGEGNPKTAEAYLDSERRFRMGARYYRLGAYAMAREQLEPLTKATPENYSAKRLLDLMGQAESGPVIADLSHE